MSVQEHTWLRQRRWARRHRHPWLDNTYPRRSALTYDWITGLLNFGFVPDLVDRSFEKERAGRRVCPYQGCLDRSRGAADGISIPLSGVFFIAAATSCPRGRLMDRERSWLVVQRHDTWRQCASDAARVNYNRQTPQLKAVALWLRDKECAG